MLQHAGYSEPKHMRREVLIMRQCPPAPVTSILRREH